MKNMLDITVILIALTISLIVAFIVIGFLMGFFRKMISIGNYMGPNATIFAIGAKYTEKEHIEKLLDYTSINEVITEIRREGYDIQDLKKYDLELELSMLSLMSKAVEMLPDDAKIFADAYMLKYDANIVKRILRAKYAKMPKRKIYEMVYEGRYITKLIIQHMVEATSMEDTISALDATPFKDCIKVWSESRDLLAVDLLMDKIVLKNLTESKVVMDENALEPVNIFLSRLIDIQNIKTVLRAKAAEIKNIQEFLIDGGYEIGEWKLKNMAEARNIEECLGQLEGTSYSFLRDIKDPFEVEVALDRYMLKIANDIGLSYSLSTGPTVMFLVSKEFEARNLKAIIKGFMENVPKERIKSLLVGGAS